MCRLPIQGPSGAFNGSRVCAVLLLDSVLLGLDPPA